jgi:hypothetical protein
LAKIGMDGKAKRREAVDSFQHFSVTSSIFNPSKHKGITQRGDTMKIT